MAPWMVIVGLIASGFLVLLIAPTVHRSINAKSRASVETARVDRANALRDSADGAIRSFPDAATAMRVRDRLLLRGIRTEVVPEKGHVVLIHHLADAAALDEVIAELERR